MASIKIYPTSNTVSGTVLNPTDAYDVDANAETSFADVQAHQVGAGTALSIFTLHFPAGSYPAGFIAKYLYCKRWSMSTVDPDADPGCSGFAKIEYSTNGGAGYSLWENVIADGDTGIDLLLQTLPLGQVISDVKFKATASATGILAGDFVNSDVYVYNCWVEVVYVDVPSIGYENV